MLTESFKGKLVRVWDENGSARRIESGFKQGILLQIASAFIPEGKVTEDYFAYQAWDSVQGLCSYIRGLLSSKAMLEGMGVGKSAATAQGAVFTIFLRDMSGTLGGILFAAANGGGLDAYAKQWRLFADCLNNVGYFLEIFSPVFPRAFLVLACLGSLARAVTGVAAGATKAALTQHFAIDNNAADVSAKEGSQESLVTLIGMLLGMGVVHFSAGSALGVWIVFLGLTMLHVYANYRAMRCLQLSSLNRPRLHIIARHYFRKKEVPTVKYVAQREHLIPDFVYSLFRVSAQNEDAIINFGQSFDHLEKAAQERLLKRKDFGSHACFLRSDSAKSTVDVVLASSCTDEQLLSFYMEALCIVYKVQDDTSSVLPEVTAQNLLDRMQSCGWLVKKAYLGASHLRIDRIDHKHTE